MSDATHMKARIRSPLRPPSLLRTLVLLTLLLVLSVMLYRKHAGSRPYHSDVGATMTAASALSAAASPSVPGLRNLTDAQINELVASSDVTAIEHMLASSGNEKDHLYRRFVASAVSASNPIVLESLLQNLTGAISNRAIGPIKLTLHDAVLKGNIEVVSCVLSHPGLIGSRSADQRLGLAAESQDQRLAELLYAHLAGDVSPQTWRRVLTAPKSESQWTIWLDRLAEAPEERRRQASELAVGDLLRADSGDPTGLPVWTPLLEHCSQRLLGDFARTTIASRRDPLFIKMVEMGLPDSIWPSLQLDTIRQTDPERWLSILAVAPSEQQVDTWWRDIVSDSLTPRRYAEWNPLLEALKDTPAPRWTSHSGTALEYAFKMRRWHLASWLLDSGAARPTTISSPEALMLVAVYDGDLAAIADLQAVHPELQETMSRSPRSTEPFGLLELAIRRGRTQVARHLLRGTTDAPPVETLNLAIEKRDREALNLLIEAGTLLPKESVLALYRSSPELADSLLAGRDKSAPDPRQHLLPILLLDAAARGSEERIESHLEQLRTVARRIQLRSSDAGSSKVALFAMLGGAGEDSPTPDEVVAAALANPAILCRLQAEGFDISFSHMLAAAESGNDAALAICLQSVMLAAPAEFDTEQLLKAAKTSGSDECVNLLHASRVAELFPRSSRPVAHGQGEGSDF